MKYAQQTLPPNGFGDGIDAWQANGGAFQRQKTVKDILRRAAVEQSALFTFFNRRQQHYFELPADLSRCRSAADKDQLRTAFITKRAKDYRRTATG